MELGLFDKFTFWFMVHFVRDSNRKNITYDDLYTFKDHSSEKYFEDFDNFIKQDETKGNLYFNLARYYIYDVLWSILMSVVLLAFTFLPSLILKKLLEFLLKKDDDLVYGYILAFLLLTVPIVNSLINQNFIQYLGHIGLQVESIVQNSIYQKTIFQKKVQSKVGELMMFMSSDSKQVGRFVQKLHTLWNTPLTIVFALFFIYQIIGYVVLIGIVCICVLEPITIKVSNIYSNYLKEYYKIRDKRVKFMSNLLLSIKTIKFYAVEEKFKKKVKKLRKNEFEYLKWVSYLEIVQSSLQYLVVQSVIVTTILFYFMLKGTLDVSQIFTIVNLFHILEHPILIFGDKYIDFMNTWVSATRILDFLNKEETNVMKKKYQDEESDIAIQMRDVKLNFNETIFEDINLDIKKGEIVCLLGDTGSGKSAFMELLTGFMNPTYGMIEVNGSIAYCSQTPWLLNKSVRDNILFGEDLHREKYNKVISVCQLEKDILSFQNGDLQMVGTNGSNLSGGQKHRLALARACYAEKDIYLIDGTFSTLDPIIQKEIFQNCFKDYLRNRTVIHITNSKDFANQSDRIIFFEKGKLKEISPQQVSEISEIKSSPPEDVPSAPQEKPKDKDFNVSLKDHLDYFKGYDQFLYFGIILVLLYSISKVVLSSYISIWSSDAYELSFKAYAIIFLMIATFQILMIPLYKISFSRGGEMASEDIHTQLFNSIIHSPMSFFEKRNIGDVLNRFSEDQTKLDQQVPYFFTIFFSFMGNLFISMVIVIYITPINIIFVGIIGGLFIVIIAIVKTPQMTITNFMEVSKGKITSNFSQSLTGIKTIHAFEAHRQFIKEHHKSIDYHHISRWMEILLQRWLALRMETLSALFGFFTAFVCIFFRDTINIPIAALSITFSLSISEQFNSAIKIFFYAENGIVAVKRIFEFLDLPPEEIEKHKEIQSWPSEGKIQFDNVTIRYETGNRALNNVNFTLGPNETIGIVGRSGSGKTTLFSSIFRLINVESGKILIDGKDISKIPLNQLRTSFSAIPQEPTFLSGSFRFNIDTEKKCSDSKIWSVLEELNLKSKILRLNLNLDDPIENFQKTFSVGEKHLFSLARALLLDSKIILFDEVTSNIDENTDEILNKIIKEKLKDKTCLIIAHNLKSIMKSCTKVAVMDTGNLKEFDTLENLLKNSDSTFNKMLK